MLQLLAIAEAAEELRQSEYREPVANQYASTKENPTAFFDSLYGPYAGAHAKSADNTLDEDEQSDEQWQQVPLAHPSFRYIPDVPSPSVSRYQMGKI